MSNTIIRRYDLAVEVAPDIEAQGPAAVDAYVEAAFLVAAQAAYGIAADGAAEVLAPITAPAPPAATVAQGPLAVEAWVTAWLQANVDTIWQDRVTDARAHFPAPAESPGPAPEEG